jgi:LPS export ABC transporter protein LptC
MRTRAVLGAAFAGALAGATPPATARAADPTLPPGLELRGMTFVSSRDGQREVLLEAERAWLEPEKELLHLENVRSVVSNEPGVPGVALSCDEGVLETRTNDFEASGQVVGETSDGRQFSTRWVKYDPRRALVFTRAPAVIVERGLTSSVGGFEYFVREQRFVGTGGAQVVREP